MPGREHWHMGEAVVCPIPPWPLAPGAQQCLGEQPSSSIAIETILSTYYLPISLGMWFWVRLVVHVPYPTGHTIHHDNLKGQK